MFLKSKPDFIKARLAVGDLPLLYRSDANNKILYMGSDFESESQNQLEILTMKSKTSAIQIR